MAISFKIFFVVFLSVIITIFPGSLFGQTKDVCLQNSINSSLTYLKKLRKNASDSALPYANNLLQEAVSKKDTWLEAEVTLELARIFFAKNDSKKALVYSLKAENLSTIKNQAYLSAPQFTSYLLDNEGRSEEALQKLFICLKRAEASNAKSQLSSINVSIADVYRRSNNSAKALPYSFNALKIAEELKDTAALIFAYANLGVTYSNSDYRTDKNLDTALYYYKKVMNEAYLKKWFTPYDSARHFYNMGRLLRLTKEYDKAASYLNVALEVANRKVFTGVKDGVLNEQMTLAMDLKNIPKALEIKKAFSKESIDNLNSLQGKKDLYQKAEDLAIQTGNYKEAYQNLTALVNVKDSLYNVEKQKAILEIEKKYESDTKVLKAINLAQKNANQRNLIIAFSLLFIILLFSIFMWSNFKKRKQAEFLKTLILEVNHRTKNNLQMLSVLISGVQQPSADDQTKADIKKLKSYIKSFGMMYENLNRSSSFDTVNLSEYVADISNAAIAGSKAEDLKLDLKTEQDLQILTEKAILTGLIVNELITNSIKHAFPRNNQNIISIHLHKATTDAFVLSYQDNGIGQIQQASKTSSFGLNMIQQLVKQMKGSIEYDPLNRKKIVIYFPTL